MAKLKFNSSGVAYAKRLATNAKNSSSTVREGIATIQRNMQSDVAARNNIAMRLSNVKTSVAQLENDILSVYKMVDNASLKYNNAESQVVKWGQQVVQGKKPASHSANSAAFSGSTKKNKDKVNKISSKETSPSNEKNKEKFDWKFDDLILDIIDNGGVTGKNVSGVISATKDIYEGYKKDDVGDIWKGILGVGDTFVSTVGELAENGFKADVDWKEMLVGNWKKGSAVTELAEKTAKYVDDDVAVALAKDQLDGFLPSTAKNVGENIKVGAQWIGVAVSGITNGIDNYDDYKDGKQSAGRAVVETISETAVDVAIGIGSTAAVGAAVVAAGASLPAVAVGAIAAGAVWVVDVGVRAATKTFMGEEKSLTEAVSDTILYVGEKYIEHEVKKVKAVGNAICSVGKSIGALWGECFG